MIRPLVGITSLNVTGLHFEQFEIGLRGLRFRKDDFTGMGIPSGSVIVSRAPGLLGLVIVPFGFMVMAVVIAVFRFGRMSVPGRSGARRPVPCNPSSGLRTVCLLTIFYSLHGFFV